MGCAPSSQNFQMNENETRLLQEIDRLRDKEQSQQLQISQLRAENDKLRQGPVLNGGYESMDAIYRDTADDESHDILVKEIERLKLEQSDKDREISELRECNEQLNLSLQNTPQVQVLWLLKFLRSMNEIFAHLKKINTLLNLEVIFQIL